MKKNRILLIAILTFFGMTLTLYSAIQNDKSQPEKANIAILAQVTGSDQDVASLSSLNDGLIPNSVPEDLRHWSESPDFQKWSHYLSNQWLQYDFWHQENL